MNSKLFFLAVLCSMSMAVKSQTYLGTSSFATDVKNPLPHQTAIEVRDLIEVLSRQDLLEKLLLLASIGETEYGDTFY